MKFYPCDFPMPIITPRLLIRPPQMGDEYAVNAAILESYDMLHEFMDWANAKPSLKETETYVQQALANWIVKKNDEPYLPLFMFDRVSGVFIGATGYHHYVWTVPCLEIGYWIRSSHLGLGLMTEAINALTQYAFKQLAVKRIAITCDVDNIRSKKIPERLHYTLEGVLKCHRRKPISGELSDTLVFAKYSLENLPLLSVQWGKNNISSVEVPMWTIEQLMDFVEKWLITGELCIEMLADNFKFISPFWESNGKNEFITKFQDPTAYRETALSKINRFDPVIKLKGLDNQCFAIILQYHTINGSSVYETVFGVVTDGLLVELRSIYDLEETKKALQL